MFLCSIFIYLSAFQMPVEAVQERGEELTNAFYRGEVAKIWAEFSENMKKALGSVANLTAAKMEMDMNLGKEVAVIDFRVEQSGPFQIYKRAVRFEKSPTPFVILWTFDSQKLVEGFFYRPIGQAAPSDYLTYQTKTQLRLPFRDSWMVFWGGKEILNNYHVISQNQRFAYDFLIQRNGVSFQGEGKKNEDYYAFGQAILSPAAGVVVALENGVEDCQPGMPNPRQLLGNHLVLDHGNGEFSLLAHFRKGSIQVKLGDKLEEGVLLGECGNSGNSTEPHLHYQLQTSADFMTTKGLPAIFRHILLDGVLSESAEPVRGQQVANPPKP